MQQAVSILSILKDWRAHILGSEWPLTQQYGLGYCLSYKELQRYEQSDVNNERPEGSLLATVKNGTFSRWPPDNVDHDVPTLGEKEHFMPWEWSWQQQQEM